SAAADYYLSPAKLESDYAPVRFERELRIFRKFCRKGVVLDVGCSSGAFLYQLNHRFAGCYEVVGTDASGPALDHADSRGLPVVRGDFLKQDFKGRKFDAVSFWAVLEHLADPRAFLEHACSLLKPEGLCFALVPNLESLASRLLRTRYRYVYPQHLNYFTRRTMSQLAPAQFEIVRTFSTHFNPVVIWQDWRGGGKEVANEERGDLLKRTTALKQNPVLAPLRALYRSAETALGALNLADNLTFIFRKCSSWQISTSPTSKRMLTRS
ncbi:MAG: class I SAM-dependent methyltransferase, partial [Limisphaerales bacterium]